mgnify:CR=1 FL=1
MKVSGFKEAKENASGPISTNKSLNFIYFTTISKQVIQLILIMLLAPMFAFRWSSCGLKPEYPEETVSPPPKKGEKMKEKKGEIMWHCARVRLN